MFLQYLNVVILHTVFGVIGPGFRGMLGTELRDPMVGELGGYVRAVTGGELL